MNKGTLDESLKGTGWSYTLQPFEFTHTNGSHATGKAAWLVARCLIRDHDFKVKLENYGKENNLTFA